MHPLQSNRETFPVLSVWDVFLAEPLVAFGTLSLN